MAFFISGFKSMTFCSIPAEVDYWNGYAQWYQRWRTHNDYHGPIIQELKWRVLNSGIGSSKYIHIFTMDPTG